MVGSGAWLQKLMGSANGGGGFNPPGQQNTAGPTPGSAQDPNIGSLGWFQGSHDRAAARYGDYGGFNNLLKQPIGGLSQVMTDAGGAAAPQAYAGLYELLAGKGKTDPTAMNWQLNDIARSTQNAQMQHTGQMAAGLNQGSGVAQAVNAAIGQGGLDRRSKVMADESQKAEQLRRADLELFMRMLVDPAVNITGIERGVQSNGGNAAAPIAAGLGGIMQGLGSMGVGG